jgi:hypothetical protein
MRARLNCPSMGPSFFFGLPAQITTTGNKEIYYSHARFRRFDLEIQVACQLLAFSH